MVAARTVELFSTVPEVLHYEAGEAIFRAGEVGHIMYGILEGTVELCINGKAVEVIEAGDVFGEGALVQPSHLRASTAIAKTPCRLAAIDETRLKFLIEHTPNFALDVMRSFSNRLRKFKHREV